MSTPTGALNDQLQQALGASYSLERELTRGGMARVFVAQDNALARRVVVKLLPHELAGGVSTDRFHREIKLLARLQHPNIVPVLTAGALADLPFFTMPFVQGESLGTRLARDGPLDAADALRILKDVAAALAYAHSEGIVHRDIKPDNVLLSGSAAMVTDFGVSKAVRDAGGNPGGELTAIGVIIGTPAYMAPEQAAADPNVDHRADIYSFGVMAYELLTGKTPFANRTPQSMMAAHIHERPKPVLEASRSVPPALAAVIMACLEKEPDARPQTAAALLDRLERVTTVKSPAGAWLLRNRRRRVTLTALSSVAAAVLVFIIATPPARVDQAPAPAAAPPSVDSAALAVRAARAGAVRHDSTRPATSTRGPTQSAAIPAGAVPLPPAPVPANRDLLASPEGEDNAPARLTLDHLYPIVGDTFTMRATLTPAGTRLYPNSRISIALTDTTVARSLGRLRFLALRSGQTVAMGTLWDSLGNAVLTGRSNILVRVRQTLPPSRTPVADTTRPAELARAIELYERFQVEAAMPILSAVIANEERFERRHVAVAYQYLAAATSVLGQADSARRLARAALARDPTIALDPERFADAEVRAFADASVEYTIVGIAPLERWVFTPGRETFAFSVGTARPAELRVLLRRAGAADVEIFRRPIEGQVAVPWSGQLNGAIAPDGRYEVLAVALGRYGPASDTARRAFELRLAGGRLVVEPARR